MKNLLPLLGMSILISIVIFSCKEKDEAPIVAPESNFSVEDSIINQNEPISFIDLSQNDPVNWQWTFEGGTPASSIEQNPVVSYDTPGIYSVRLTTNNSAGTDSYTKTSFITVVPSTNLVAYCPFNNNLYDYSGNGLNAINNGVIFENDIYENSNSAASFSDSAYFSIQHDELLNFGTNDFSISLWLKTYSTGRQMIFQKGGLNNSSDPQFWLRLNDTHGNITFLTGDGNSYSTIASSQLESVSFEEWSHLVVIRNGENLLIYLDNDLVAEENGLKLDTDTEQNLNFGLQVLNGYSTNPYFGKMDEIRIYSRALSESEIGILNTIK